MTPNETTPQPNPKQTAPFPAVSVVGRDLTLRLVNLTTGQTLRQVVLNRTMFSQGPVGLIVESYGHSFYEVVLDNFFVTGTTP